VHDHDDYCPACDGISLAVALSPEGDMVLLIDDFPVPLDLEQAERLARGFREAVDWSRWIKEVRDAPL
jgi:hypothetical protein